MGRAAPPLRIVSACAHFYCGGRLHWMRQSAVCDRLGQQQDSVACLCGDFEKIGVVLLGVAFRFQPPDLGLVGEVRLVGDDDERRLARDVFPALCRPSAEVLEAVAIRHGIDESDDGRVLEAMRNQRPVRLGSGGVPNFDHNLAVIGRLRLNPIGGEARGRPHVRLEAAREDSLNDGRLANRAVAHAANFRPH